MWRLLLILFLSLPLHAATYYVATNGNDSAAGSYAAPWLTVTNAAKQVVAGDTVIVLQGFYTNPVTCAVEAAADNRITFQGSNNPAVDSWTLQKSYYTIDGFHINGTNQASVVTAGEGKSPHGIWIINNTFTNLTSDRYMIRFFRCGIWSSNNPSFLVISNNTFVFPPGFTARCAITCYGGTNQIRANKFFGANTLGECDTFQVYGKDNVIADNLIQDCGNGSAGEKGGDVWQVFGWLNWCLFYMPNLSAYNPQDGDSYTLRGTTRTWKTTVTDAATQIQIGDKYENVTNMINQFDAYPITGVKRYPLEASSVGGTNVLRVLFAGNDTSSVMTSAEVGAWFLLYTAASEYSPQEKEVSGIIIERNKIVNSYFQVCQLENYESDTNVFGGTVAAAIWRNNIFVSNRYTGAVGMNNVKFWNNTFYRCAYSGGNPISIGSTKGDAYGTEFYNNVFYDCGPSTSGSGWYAPGSAAGINYSIAADYNYVCGPANAAKDAYPPDANTRWGSYGWEANGINGGDAKLAAPTNVYPKVGSVLIGAGTNLSVRGFTNDFNNMIRTDWDIGAVMHDTNLLMWLDFGQGVDGGKVVDVSGYDHHAWRMDSTNWITTTNGPRFDLTAAEWHFVGTNPDGYRFSQYAAITNVPGTALAKITNGTITAWIRWDTNYDGAQPFPERGDMIMDAGCDLSGSAVNDPDTATNSWQFGFAKTTTSPYGYRVVFQVTPTNDYNESQNILTYWPDAVRTPTAWQWKHYAVVWNGGGYSTNYADGVAVGTNLLGHPYLTVGGRTNAALPGWICLGAMTHGGDPRWADGIDSYPNAFYFKGEMADVRIYSRALQAEEVANVYGGVGTMAATGESEPETPAATSVLRVKAARVNKIKMR